MFMRRKGGKNKNYSAKFKRSVIVDMRENHLGYRETIWSIGTRGAVGKKDCI